MPTTARPSWSVVAFALWTLFVWGGRLRNLWLEPGGLADVGRWSLVGALLFTALGLALLGLAGVPAVGRPVVAVLGVLTVGVWLVRAVDIALGDHSAGFIAVHVALAVVSIGLAVTAWRATTPSPPGRGAIGRPITGRAEVG